MEIVKEMEEKAKKEFEEEQTPNDEKENNNKKSDENKNSEEKNQEENKEKDSDKIELLEYFLDFVKTEELNYVLSGYFSKFFTALMNKGPNVIIKYLYKKNPEVLKCFFNHLKVKAISDLIPKIIFNSMEASQHLINFQANDDKSKSEENKSESSENMEEYNDMRNELVISIFTKLNLENDIETTNNIVNVCIELIENKTLLEFICSNEIILENLFKNLSINLNRVSAEKDLKLMDYNYKEILILVLNLLRTNINETKLPSLLESISGSSEDIVNFNSSLSLDQNKIKNTIIGKFILENFNKIMQNFLFENNENSENNNENEGNLFVNDTTYGVRAKTLGYKR